MAKKTFIGIKRGLSEDSRHRARMGNRIWLYMHIIDRCNWETGIVEDWKDEEEARDMDMPYYTLKQHRQELADLGYVTCVKHLHGQRIIIHNWVNPRNYSGAILNRRPIFDQTDADQLGVNTPEYLGVHLGVHSAVEYPPPSIKDHISHDQQGSGLSDPIWDKALASLRQALNGTFESANPRLMAVDENPHRFTVLVDQNTPGLKRTIEQSVEQGVKALKLRRRVSVNLVTDWPGYTPARRVKEIKPVTGSKVQAALADILSEA